MRSRANRLALLAGAALAGCCPAPALADTLKEALVDAYQTNPTLQAARANQRATDENVPIDRASGLPSLSGTATYYTSSSRKRRPIRPVCSRIVRLARG